MEPRALGAALLTLLFWASAFAAIRAGLEGLEPGHLVLLRFLVAGALLLLYALLRGLPPPRREDLPRLFLLGFLGITVYHTALVYGELTVSAGAASLLIATGPVFTALLSYFLLGERLRPLGVFGFALAFFGALVLALGEGGGCASAPGPFDPPRRSLHLLLLRPAKAPLRPLWKRGDDRLHPASRHPAPFRLPPGASRGH